MGDEEIGSGRRNYAQWMEWRLVATVKEIGIDRRGNGYRAMK